MSDKEVRMYPDDGGLKPQVRDISEGLSAFAVIKDHFGLEPDKAIDTKEHTLQDDVKSYYQYEKTFLDEVGGWAQDDNIPSEEWIWYAVSLMAALTVLFILLK